MAFCSQCGRELADGAKFCFECGNQVAAAEEIRRTVFSGEIHKCPQCGEVLNAYEAFCGTCGYEIRGSGVSESVQKFAEQLKTATTEYQKATIIQGYPIPNNREDIFEFLILATSNIDRHLNKAVLAAWVSKIEQSYRKARLVLRQEQDLDQVEDIYAEAQEKIRELNHERIQHKKMPSLPQPQKKSFFRWTPMTTIGMVLGFLIIIVTILITVRDPEPDHGTKPSETIMTESLQTPEQGENTNLLTIEQGKEYTYGADTSDLYVATAVSDSVLKIEKWKRGLLLQTEYTLKYEVGAYRINDPDNGFSWLDEQHGAFRILLKDQQTAAYRKGKEIIFTESWVDGNLFKGSNCLNDVYHYEHLHDDWHLYKAVPVSQELLKIECWYRPLPVGAFYYGYDVCVIDLRNGDLDLKWSDEERSSFTVNLQDSQNSSLKEAAFVVFEETQ